jgi:predicted SAM-dependent methyltransferase
MQNRTPLTPRNFRPEDHPRRLNVGCGGDHREGYVNVDLNAWYKPDLVADARDLSFLPSSYYDELIAQDVLEHLPRTQTLRTLMVWNRVLKPGGRLWLRVPSVVGIVDLLQRKENRTPQAQEELIQCLFGTQAYTGDFHFTSFTEVLLHHYLESAGFKVKDITLAIGWLFDVTAVKAAHIETPTVRDWGELLAIAGDEPFVAACYREILQRAPDEGGLRYYVEALSEGMARGNVIDAMLGGPEYRALKQRAS